MKYRVQLTFVLNEEVTPAIFAERVLSACAYYYALREGEGIEKPAQPGVMICMVSNCQRTEEKIA